jgi:hypothetical protein
MCAIQTTHQLSSFYLSGWFGGDLSVVWFGSLLSMNPATASSSTTATTATKSVGASGGKTFSDRNLNGVVKPPVGNSLSLLPLTHFFYHSPLIYSS